MSSRARRDGEFAALYTTARKLVPNPHEFMRLTSSRRYCKCAVETPRAPPRYAIADLWDPDGKSRSTSRLRRIEASPAGARPPRPPMRVSATDQIEVLGQCLVHPIIEIDYVGAPALHRYPHLRKFCSMVDFYVLSPQRVAACYVAVRLFPDRWQRLFRYELPLRTQLGAQRYAETFDAPAPAELLEISELFREYFLPVEASVSALVERHRRFLSDARVLTASFLVAESRNEAFRLAVFLGCVLRQSVGENFAVIERLFALIGEMRLSLRRSRVLLAELLRTHTSRLGAAEEDEVASILCEFRLPKRKFALLTPHKLK